MSTRLAIDHNLVGFMRINNVILWTCRHFMAEISQSCGHVDTLWPRPTFGVAFPTLGVVLFGNLKPKHNCLPKIEDNGFEPCP